MTSNTRLSRAYDAFSHNKYQFTLVPIKSGILVARCQSDSGKKYDLVYFHGKIQCSCPDSHFRGAVCKHAVVFQTKLEAFRGIV